MYVVIVLYIVQKWDCDRSKPIGRYCPQFSSHISWHFCATCMVFLFFILFLFIYFFKFFQLFGNLTWPVDCLNDAHGSHFGDLCFTV
jgi:hypothetical protein